MSFEAELKERYARAHRNLIRPNYSPSRVLKVIPKIDAPPSPPIPTKEVIPVTPKKTPPKQIIRRPYALEALAHWLCVLENVELSELVSQQRPKGIVIPRLIFYHLAYKHAFNRFTSAEIGRFLNKDHTSVLSGIERMAVLRRKNKELDKKVRDYEEGVYKLGKQLKEGVCPFCGGLLPKLSPDNG